MINKSKDEIKTCLMYYIPRKYWVLNDWDIIIKRCTKIKDNVFLFRCSFFQLYFDSEMHPITYGKMIVCETKNNRVYYNFQEYNTYQTEPPIPLGEYDWENQIDWGD